MLAHINRKIKDFIKTNSEDLYSTDTKLSYIQEEFILTIYSQIPASIIYQNLFNIVLSVIYIQEE